MAFIGIYAIKVSVWIRYYWFKLNKLLNFFFLFIFFYLFSFPHTFSLTFHRKQTDTRTYVPCCFDTFLITEIAKSQLCSYPIWTHNTHLKRKKEKENKIKHTCHKTVNFFFIRRKKKQKLSVNCFEYLRKLNPFFNKKKKKFKKKKRCCQLHCY